MDRPQRIELGDATVAVVHRDPRLSVELTSVHDRGRLWTQFHETYLFCHAHEQHTEQAWSYRHRAYSCTLEETMLIEPGELHVTTRGARAELSLLSISPATAQQMLGDRRFHFKTGQTPDATTRERFGHLCRLAQHAVVEPLALDDAVVAFLATVVEACADAPTGLRAPRCGSSVRLVAEYLRENYAQKIRLEELATLTGLSMFHLSRVFRRQLGVPVHRYLTLVRSEKARAMLESGRSISEVAVATGFFDQAHFTRQFAKVYGLTPGQYRQGARRPTR